MGLKVKSNSGNGDSKVDWNAINVQVEDDTHEARVSLIVDLGEQKRADAVYGIGMNKANVSYFATEEEAHDYIDEANDIVGDWVMDKEGYDVAPEEVTVDAKLLELLKDDKELSSLDEGDTIFKVDFKIKSRKNAEEVAYFADLVDVYVDYGEDMGAPKQFRVMLNKTDFKTRELQGYAMSNVPPMKDGGIWTFAPLSMHTKLAKATGCSTVLEDGDDAGDVSLFLDKPLGLPTTQSTKGDKTYLKVGAPCGLPKKVLALGVTELDVSPEAITFEDATVEQLENATLRKAVIDKIKKAVNYPDSQIQKAIEEWEASKGSASKKDEEEAPEQKKAPKKAKKKVVAKKVVEEEEDAFDEDIPF